MLQPGPPLSPPPELRACSPNGLAGFLVSPQPGPQGEDPAPPRPAPPTSAQAVTSRDCDEPWEPPPLRGAGAGNPSSLRRDVTDPGGRTLRRPNGSAAPASPLRNVVT